MMWMFLMTALAWEAGEPLTDAGPIEIAPSSHPDGALSDAQIAAEMDLVFAAWSVPECGVPGLVRAADFWSGTSADPHLDWVDEPVADDVPLGLSSQVPLTDVSGAQSATCAGETSMAAVLSHRVGHYLGLGHACEDDSECAASELRDAMMYFAVGPCDADYEPGVDDLRGLAALYADVPPAGGAGPSCAETADGVVECGLDEPYDSAIGTATWTWGAQTELGNEVVFETAGEGSVAVCFEPSPTADLACPYVDGCSEVAIALYMPADTAEELADEGSCGCRSAPGAAWLALFALALVRRRR